MAGSNKDEALSSNTSVELDTTTTDPVSDRVLPTPFGEGTSGDGGGGGGGAEESGEGDDNDEQGAPPASPAVGQSRLNPFALEWDPHNNGAPEEDRCCFLTFSNGYPLTERQIYNFFTQRFGPLCVERVYIHRRPQRVATEPPQPQPPLFGKVVFRSVLMPALVLGGREQVRFRVDRKPLWCKRFDKSRLRAPSFN